MCPACMATLAILVTGVVSSGGVAALVVSKLRAAGSTAGDAGGASVRSAVGERLEAGRKGTRR
jgi:hypothetical protein